MPEYRPSLDISNGNASRSTRAVAAAGAFANTAHESDASVPSKTRHRALYSRLALAGVICNVVLLSGCGLLEPKYQRPDAPIVSQYPTSSAAEAARDLANKTPNSTDASGINAVDAADIGWKQVFQDPHLQDMIQRALTDNRQLRVAQSTMEQARSLYGASRSKLFPEFDGSAVAQRQRLPGLVQTTSNGGLGPVVNTSSKASVFNEFQVQGGVQSFQLDLFGANLSAMHSAKARAEAAAATYQASRLALVGEVANAYLTLQSDLALQALTQDTLNRRTQYATVMSKAFQNGGAAEFDMRRADSLARAAGVDLDTAKLAVDRDINALTLLVGSQIPATDLQPVANPDAMLAAVPAGLPSTLLNRRPDIAAAEAQLREANADIGQARAAFFPTITLTGLLGTLSGNLSGVFGSGSQSWLGGATVSVPFFDWGYRKRELDATKAEWRGALASYDNTVQSAFRDVADELAIRDHMSVQVQQQEALVNELRRVEHISHLRFEGADGDYLAVQDAERTRFQAERQLIETRLTANVNMVNLYQSLGGGWTADSVASAAPAPAPAPASVPTSPNGASTPSHAATVPTVASAN